jgi:hypothetical protein
MDDVCVLRLAYMHKSVYPKPLYETSDLPKHLQIKRKKLKVIFYKYKPWI